MGAGANSRSRVHQDFWILTAHRTVFSASPPIRAGMSTCGLVEMPGDGKRCSAQSSRWLKSSAGHDDVHRAVHDPALLQGASIRCDRAADLLAIALIADAVQIAMANEHRSITEGTLRVLTIVFGNFAVDRLDAPSARYSRMRRHERPSAHDKDARLSLEFWLLGDGGVQAVEPSGDVG